MRELLRRAADPRPGARRQHPLHGQHAVHQHHPARRSSRPSRATASSSGASRASSAGTRWRWWCAPTASSRASAATSRPTPRRPRSTRSASTTSSAAAPTSFDGDSVFFQGHASPGIYARAFLEGRLGEQRPGRTSAASCSAGRRPLQLPAPLADAGLLGVPHRLDGPGPLMAIYQARFNHYLEDRGLRARQRRARSGPSSATARWTSPSRSAPSPWPRASSSTTSSSSSTATCSGSTARCAATARSSRSSRPPSAAPAGT